MKENKSHVACGWALPIEIVKGEGCFLTDRDNKRYIDFTGGWCVGTHGWGNPEIAKAITEEAKKALYIPPTLTWRGWEELADILTQHAPGKGKLTRAYRCCSGSEAVEFAMKCARAATGKNTIVSVADVYHGHTYGAASVGTAITRKMGPGVPFCEKIPMPRSPTIAEQALTELESLFKKGDVAMFLSEPVFSNAGVYIPPADFYPKVQKLCRQYDVLLAMDEVAVGFGRCGKLFASELWGLEPDILCLGKALTGGYGTLGATLVTEEIFKKCQGMADYATFGWTCLNTAAAMANVKRLIDQKLWKNSEKMGVILLSHLKKLEGKGGVREVRGKGLLVGLSLIHKDASKIQKNCLERGLYIESWNEADGNAYLFISPPLVIDEPTIIQGATILESIILNS